jgi:hypothetical protein
MATFVKSTSSKVLSFSQGFKNNGVPFIFQGELFRTLERSSLSTNVKTILLSSLSSVINGLESCQACWMLIFIESLEKGLREIILPIKVGEGGRGRFVVGSTKVGVWSSKHYIELV